MYSITEFFTRVWSEPHALMEDILKRENPAKGVLTIIIIYGILVSLISIPSLLFMMAMLVDEDSGVFLILAGILAFFLYIGITVGGFYIAAWALNLVSGWIGGKGSNQNMRIALGYTYLLMMVYMVLFILVGIISVISGIMLGGIMGLLSLPVGIYLIYIMCQFIAAVQKFSGWKALGALFLSGLFLALIFVVIMTAIGLVGSSIANIYLS